MNNAVVKEAKIYNFKKSAFIYRHVAMELKFCKLLQKHVIKYKYFLEKIKIYVYLKKYLYIHRCVRNTKFFMHYGIKYKYIYTIYRYYIVNYEKDFVFLESCESEKHLYCKEQQ